MQFRWRLLRRFLLNELMHIPRVYIRKFLGGMFAVIVATMVYFFFRTDPQAAFGFSPEQFSKRLLDSSVVLLDVRTMEEFNSSTGHLPNAKSIPVQEMELRLADLDLNHQSVYLVYCRTHNRSKRAVDILRRKGFEAYFLIGGIQQWSRESRLLIRSENK